ncbi:hypothetical protein [Helicobacter marmotae]|uniref:hypothetical protein n=1 Tax=Helicobacter marmotae TaxID=152490 RepID=UPI001FCF90F7|nr:hypothetical protein [Helicobacter marmotae]
MLLALIHLAHILFYLCLGIEVFFLQIVPIPQITKSNQYIVDKLIALVEANCHALENEASEKSPSQTPSGSKVCHSKHCEETQPELPASPLLCQL